MPSLAWYANRLRSMSLPEIGWRVTTTVVARVDYLLPIRTPLLKRGSAPDLRPWTPPAALDAAPYIEAAQRVSRGEVDLFGRTYTVGDADWNQDPATGTRVPLVRGTTLDCRDPSLVGDARSIWELNRHFQLVTLAQGWALTGDDAYRCRAETLLSSWLEACPYPLGINWASALEHGIRLINWYLAGRLLGGRLTDQVASTKWLESIYWHCHFIARHRSRYSSANNHLIGEMAGLYVGAIAWPVWSESKGWQRLAKEKLIHEVELQVHSDGVSREQTVGYQIFVLQFLIVAGLAGEHSGDPFPAPYWSAVRKMIGFLRAIADRSGNLPNFGDSDDGMAFKLSPSALPRRLSDLLDIETLFSEGPGSRFDPKSAAAWLQTSFSKPRHWPAEHAEPAASFPEGGYFVLGRDYEDVGDARIVFDAAPLGYLSIAAHGHADCLSFVLSIGGQEILVDPGTYCYFGDSQFRNYFRGTAAHNTVRVDGEDQSEMAGPFMWLTKARPKVSEFDSDGAIVGIRARHDGYQRLSNPVVHERQLTFDREGASITVVDRLFCGASHEIERNWHFSEQCEVTVTGPGSALIRRGALRLEFRTDADTQLILRKGSLSPPGGWISRRFGSRTETCTLVAQGRIEGDSALSTQFHWKMAP